MTNTKERFIKIHGEDIAYHRLENDVNGNPRYLVHFLSLGIKPEDYGNEKFRDFGLKKYRGKWFGGGYVFQSYELQSDLKWILGKIKEYYNQREEN